MSKSKRLVKDTLFYGLSTMIQRTLTFLLLPFYTNLLTQTDVGNYVNVLNWFGVFIVLFGFGIETAYFRFYRERDGKNVFSQAFIFSLLISMIGTVTILYFAKPIAAYFGEAENIVAMVEYSAIILSLDTLMLIPFAYLRMEYMAKRFAIYKLLMVIVAISITMYLILVEGQDAVAIFRGYFISSVFGMALAMPYVLKNIKFKIDGFQLKELLRFGVPTIPAGLSVILLRSGDQILIKLLRSPEELAIYNVSYKLAIPMMLFVTTFDWAWKPFYNNHYKDSNSKEFFGKVFNIYVFILCLIFLLACFFLPLIVKLDFGSYNFYPETYWEGLRILPMVIGGFFFIGIYNFFGMGLNLAKKTIYLPISVIVAVIVNLVLNYIFLPEYGYMVSAWLTLLSYFLAAFIVYFISQKHYPMNYNLKNLFLMVGFTLGIYLLINNIELDNLFKLPIMILAIGLFYLVASKLKIIDYRDIIKVLKR